ncbi:MAG: hypothetical protein WDM92_06420 [Caulobacteraceae bacterium]
MTTVKFIRDMDLPLDRQRTRVYRAGKSYDLDAATLAVATARGAIEAPPAKKAAGGSSSAASESGEPGA